MVPGFLLSPNLSPWLSSNSVRNLSGSSVSAGRFTFTIDPLSLPSFPGFLACNSIHFCLSLLRYASCKHLNSPIVYLCLNLNKSQVGFLISLSGSLFNKDDADSIVIPSPSQLLCLHLPYRDTGKRSIFFLIYEAGNSVWFDAKLFSACVLTEGCLNSSDLSL